MVRAGENAFLIDDFKENNFIAIGWEIGDLTGKSPDEIKKIMLKYHPDAKKTSLGNSSAQIIKFVCDFEVGDYIISYNPNTRKYLVGEITSDYYYSTKLAELHKKTENFYSHCRNVKWVGETSRDDLSNTALRPLKSIMTIFSLSSTVKNEILTKLNNDMIEWVDFYIEFADKLLEYKNNRLELINKIYDIFDKLNMALPTLENDAEGNVIKPYDLDPFTVFGLFNKQISTESRIKIITQIKEEFSLKTKIPLSFHGISLVNNLKATFYYFTGNRDENDINNLWELYEIALNFSNDNYDKFIEKYNIVLNQMGIKWNITMALNWIRPFTFINLDVNNRKFLSNNKMFSDEFNNEIKLLKTPPKAEQYIHICNEVKNVLNKSKQFNNFPELSHYAYIDKFKDSNVDDDGIGDGDVRQSHYWLISPGSNALWWDEFYNHSEMGIGFKGTGNLKQYNSKEELKNKFQEIHNDNASHKNDVNACWQFLNELKVGDIVFAKKGMGEIIGKGIVESEYIYDKTKPYHKIRKVNWTHKGVWSYDYGKLPMKTLTDITMYQEMVDNINELFASEEEPDNVPEIQYPDYTIDKFLEEVYINEYDYQILVGLLQNKKNLIIEGAPGVGKTFMAKRLAYSMIGVKDISRVMMVQFHQSYSYEDFVMGYRPYENGFKLKYGSFYKFCKKASDDEDNDYFFIIDEINRGNLSKIFGELFMLIEADKRGEKNKIQLLYSDESFYIPKNVYIIGLMNTADRSLAMIDYALRRRFAFFDLKPGFDSDGFKTYQNELSDDTFDSLIAVMKQLNEDIKTDESLGEGFRIGHSYLCNLKQDSINDKLNYIVEYELIPLLKEYWFDEVEKVKYWTDQLRRVVNDSF